MATAVQWWVYIVQTQSGKLYTGISTDIDRRFAEHCEVHRGGKKGAKFFRTDPAKELVYRERCLGKSDACKREAAIKKLPREEKCLLAGLDRAK